MAEQFAGGMGGAQRATQDLASNMSRVRSALDIAGTPAIALVAKDSPFTFPAQYSNIDPIPIHEKAKVTELIPGVAKQIILPITDEDVKTIRAKEEIQSQAQFDAWVSSKFKPYTDPSGSEWLQRIYPEFFEARAKENAEKHLIKEKYENILLMGPKSKEDLYLMYQVERDPDLRFKVFQSTGPFWGKGLSAPDVPRDSTFVRGLLNPRRTERLSEAVAVGNQRLHGDHWETARDGSYTGPLDASKLETATRLALPATERLYKYGAALDIAPSKGTFFVPNNP